MTEIASKINARTLAPAEPAKPFRTYPVDRTEPAQAASTPFTALLLLLVLSLLGGFLVMLNRGGLARWQSLVGSSESVISLVFLAQVAAAVVCFAFLIRWMRR